MRIVFWTVVIAIGMTAVTYRVTESGPKSLAFLVALVIIWELGRMSEKFPLMKREHRSHNH